MILLLYNSCIIADGRYDVPGGRVDVRRRSGWSDALSLRVLRFLGLMMGLTAVERQVLEIVRNLPAELMSDYTVTSRSQEMSRRIRQAPRDVAQQLLVESLHRLVALSRPSPSK